MKILLAQINPHVGAIAANTAQITDVYTRHCASADLIVFPELSITGYPPEDLVLNNGFLDAVAGAVQKLCALKGKAAMLVSAPWRMSDGKTYNALLLIDGGHITHIIPKHHLPNYGVFDEVRIFAAGPLPAPIPFRGIKLGLMTCEDIWFADTAAQLKAQGADILIIPNASPYDTSKQAARLAIAQARIAETGLPLIYLNQIGGQDSIVYDGASFGVQADGTIAFQMPFCAAHETLVTFEGGKLAADTTPYPAPLACMFDALKLGLRDYVLKNGFKGVLIGLSGGIDSALVAVIAAEALGPENVTCVMMPSPYTAQMSLDDAAALAKNLGCDYRVIPINEGMKVFDTMLGDDAAQGVTPENIQSRLRGMLLMALSNTYGRMVVATGNKSEMAMGYATLYGDMCGGYAAIKDVYKTDVFALCNWINARAETPLIPPRIITRPPSAELRDNQKDEDSLPPYEVLDAILKGLVEDDLTVADIVAKGFDGAMVAKVARMLKLAEYKRRQAPPGPKISPRAFSHERRYPITNGFTLEKPPEKG